MKTWAFVQIPTWTVKWNQIQRNMTGNECKMNSKRKEHESKIKGKWKEHERTITFVDFRPRKDALTATKSWRKHISRTESLPRKREEQKNDNFILGHLKRPRLFFTIPYVYLFVCVWILYHLLFWHGRDCEGLWMACVLPSAVSGEAGRGICHGHCRACCTQTGQLRLSQG